MARPPGGKVQKPTFSQSNLRLEQTALRLIALLIADKPLKYACKKYALHNLLAVASEVESSEVIQMTVEVATTYRLLHWNSKHHEETHPVGDLWPVASVDVTEPLSVLEACNKIIHATYLSFWRRKVRSYPAEYLEPYVIVTGAKGKKTWEAQIHMLLFCNEVLAWHGNHLPNTLPTGK